MLFVCHPKFCINIVFSFSWGHFNSQEKLKTMLMQNFGVTNKELVCYGISGVVNLNLNLHHHIDTCKLKKYSTLPRKTWKVRQQMIKTCSYGAKNVVNFTTETNQQRFIGQNWQAELWNYAQNLSHFKDSSNPMISFDPKFFKAAVRSSLDKILWRCLEERTVEVCYRGLNL